MSLTNRPLETVAFTTVGRAEACKLESRRLSEGLSLKRSKAGPAFGKSIAYSAGGKRPSTRPSTRCLRYASLGGFSPSAHRSPTGSHHSKPEAGGYDHGVAFVAHVVG